LSIKVWISKYALTTGIIEKEVRINDELAVSVESQLDSYYGEGKQWHKTKEDAIKRAEEMRKRKIISVEKQLKKLKEMKF
jgi:hypothetical protein